MKVCCHLPYSALHLYFNLLCLSLNVEIVSRTLHKTPGFPRRSVALIAATVVFPKQIPREVMGSEAHSCAVSSVCVWIGLSQHDNTDAIHGHLQDLGLQPSVDLDALPLHVDKTQMTAVPSWTNSLKIRGALL